MNWRMCVVMPMPEIEYLKTSQVDILGKVLRQKLLNADSSLAKSYLNILVDEIVVENKTATIRGSKAALAETMQQIKRVQNQCPVLTLMASEYNAFKYCNKI